MLRTDSSDLIDSSLENGGQPLPEWLPDETLFSLLSRYHCLTGNRLSSDTCRVLFGRPRQGCQHDFPSHLDALVLRNDGAIGDALNLIHQRTILPFYLRFNTELVADEVMAALRAGTAESIKYRLGILTSRFRANHPLKACPQCLRADQEVFGTAYWHLSHQYPGVWWCPEHNAPLLQATVKSTGVERFLWHLPSIPLLMKATPLHIDTATHAALQHFAVLAWALAKLPMGFRFDPPKLAKTYRQALKARGLTTSSGRIKLADAALAYVQAIAGLRVIPELAALPDKSSHAGSLMTRLLGRPASVTHPLRHLSMIYWLFQDWGHFMACYAGATDHSFQDMSATATAPARRHAASRQQLLACLEQGDSLRRAASAIGVDYQTAATWATEAGYTVRRRAKTLKPELLAGLKRDLSAGMAKRDAADQYGVSIESVTRILFTEPGLHGEWEHARREMVRRAARQAWLDAMQALPGSGIKLVRAYAPAAYAWLYRHDRAWLTAQSRDIPRQPRTGGQRVDWDARDAWLAQQVRQTALALVSSSTKRSLQLSQLYQVIPELKAKLGKLNRLPLTTLAIVEALKRRRSSQA